MTFLMLKRKTRNFFWLHDKKGKKEKSQRQTKRKKDKHDFFLMLKQIFES